MFATLRVVVLSTLLAVARSWVVVAPQQPAGTCAAACAACAPATFAGARRSLICMQEGADAPAAEAAAPAAPAAAEEAVSDFTEDLLDALTADDEPLVEFDEPAQFVKGAEGVEPLTPLGSWSNEQAVEALRSKYALHENDTGSSQVQIAVLTARIAYMTKHMETNKKDYSSLRGLTAMVTRRRKLLEFLLREDLGEFKRLTSELGIRTNQLLKPKLQGARGRRV